MMLVFSPAKSCTNLLLLLFNILLWKWRKNKKVSLLNNSSFIVHNSLPRPRSTCLLSTTRLQKCPRLFLCATTVKWYRAARTKKKSGWAHGWSQHDFFSKMKRKREKTHTWWTGGKGRMSTFTANSTLFFVFAFLTLFVLILFPISSETTRPPPNSSQKMPWRDCGSRFFSSKKKTAGLKWEKNYRPRNSSVLLCVHTHTNKQTYTVLCIRHDYMQTRRRLYKNMCVYSWCNVRKKRYVFNATASLVTVVISFRILTETWCGKNDVCLCRTFLC